MKAQVSGLWKMKLQFPVYGRWKKFLSLFLTDFFSQGNLKGNLNKIFFLAVARICFFRFGSRDLYLKRRKFLKNLLNEYVRAFKSLFCLHTFRVRCFIDVLDPENQPGSVKIQTGSGSDSRLFGLQRTFDTKSMKTKKEEKLSKIFIQFL